MEKNISYLALNFQLSEDTDPQGGGESHQAPGARLGRLPRQLLLVPAGNFGGLDGRTWHNPSPQAVIARTRQIGRDIPIDIEHATELKGPQGEPAPAQGWIRLADLKVIEGAIWGSVQWNNTGQALLADKAYRYYSPAFLYDNQGEVRSLKSVGLTNSQNLAALPALNHQTQNLKEGADDMSLPASVRQALGLGETANEADAVQAIGTLKQEHQLALNRAETPDPEQFVTKADYTLALNRANSAEDELKQRREAEISAEIDAAVKAGKVAPASKDYHLAICQQAGGLDKFRQFVAAAPVLVGTEGVGGKKPEGDQQQSKLNADELAICRDLGLTEDEFLSVKA